MKTRHPPALVLSILNQEICGQKSNLYAIVWKILTFMKDNYDIYENEKKIISNAMQCNGCGCGWSGWVKYMGAVGGCG